MSPLQTEDFTGETALGPSCSTACGVGLEGSQVASDQMPASLPMSLCVLTTRGVMCCPI